MKSFQAHALPAPVAPVAPALAPPITAMPLAPSVAPVAPLPRKGESQVPDAGERDLGEGKIRQ